MRYVYAIALVGLVLALSRTLMTRTPELASATLPRQGVSELRLRQWLDQHNKPQCSSHAAGEYLAAVVVFQVDVRPTGAVYSTHVVSTERPSVAKEIASAVRSWHFRVPDGYAPPGAWLTGKLTFYVVNHTGRCVVLEPSEAPDYEGWGLGRVPGQSRGEVMSDKDRRERR